ncbi:MAG: patatin-like phospholipase family protein [Mucilaginibacter sp.]
MAENLTDQKTFYIGLCMAGAVSAGAYTAGVMDYLLEALSNWEKHRGEAGIPTHKVQIPVMGGASAGGMTSVMTAAALNNPITHIDKPSANLMAEHPENKLYHSWVDLTGVDMFSKMLDTSDIDSGDVTSGLNSDFINPIADRVVAVDPDQWQPLPAFIKSDLKVFTTLTNLQGFDYTVDFGDDQPQTAKYHMNIHNDYACFQLTEETITGDNDGWMPLNLKNKINASTAADAAMATGAFPVGLKSRKLTRDARYINANPWLKDYLKNGPLTGNGFETLNVDGGLINNEPFDRVRDVLNSMPGRANNNYQDFNQFNSTVLMIEPFPTQKASEISKKQSLGNVIGLTLSSMISQMRTKPVNIKDALKESCAGQYLITPSRIVKGPDGKTENITGERAIACGALDGFSGFISKEFRVHDFFLGRYNCKIFLRDYFTVPAETLQNNPIFRDGYANADREKFRSTKDDSYQIIPVFADETDYTFPDIKFTSGTNWPVLQESDIDRFRWPLKKRTGKVLLNMLKLKPVARALIWCGSVVILNRLVAGKIIGAIKSDLRTWKLLR